ncbi:MAG: pilin [Candidatus Doudnabacteria bacterium]|nr:pilin [Candidatus Doudnabacteria bacterium]
MKKVFLRFLLLFAMLTFTGVACDKDASQSTQLCNPTEQFAANLPTAAVFVVKAFGQLIGWTALAYLMFAGFRMIMSQGNEEDIAKAKSTFQWTLSGFVLALLSYVLIYAISDFLGVAKDGTSGGAGGLQTLNPLESQTFGELFIVMFKNFLIVAGLISMFLIILSGFRYITSRGNDEQVGQAKRGLTWAVIGLIVILLSYVILVATAKLIGADVVVTK